MLTSSAPLATLLRSPIPIATMAVALVLVLLPNLWLTPLGAHDDQRLLQVGTLALVAAWVTASAEVRGRVAQLVGAHGRTWAVVGGAFAVGLASAALAPDPFTGVLEVAMFGALLLLMLAVAAEETLHPGRSTTTIVAAVVIAVALQLLPLAKLPNLSDGAHELWQDGGLGGGFSHPRFLNQFQAMAIPLLGALCASHRRVVRVPALALVTMSAWSLVLTEGRGATLAVSTVLVALAVAGGSAGRRWARATAAPAVLGAAAALITRRIVSLPGLLMGRDISSSSGRIHIWTDALDRAVAHPILGVGPGHLAHVEVVPVDFDASIPAHPHNSVLQLVAEWGVPAALALVAVVAVVGVALLRRPAPALGPTPLGTDGSVVAVGATAAVGAGLLLSLVSGVIVMPTAQTLLAAVAGLALAHRWTWAGPTADGADHEHRAVPPAWAGWLLSAAMVASVAVLLVEVGPRPVAERLASQETYLDVAEDEFLDPRFWQQGIRGVTAAP